jgi:hypothetical protein
VLAAFASVSKTVGSPSLRFTDFLLDLGMVSGVGVEELWKNRFRLVLSLTCLIFIVAAATKNVVGF